MVECTDPKCPIHGKLSVRGNLFGGRVVSAKPGKTAIIERILVRYVPKYERYKKTRGRIYAHNPPCINAKENDIVKVGETRKLSKTKSFVVLSITGKEKHVKVEEDTLQEKKKEKVKAGKEKGQEKPEKEEGKEKQETKEEKQKKEDAEKGKEKQEKAEKPEKTREEKPEDKEKPEKEEEMPKGKEKEPEEKSE